MEGLFQLEPLMWGRTRGVIKAETIGFRFQDDSLRGNLTATTTITRADVEDVINLKML